MMEGGGRFRVETELQKSPYCPKRDAEQPRRLYRIFSESRPQRTLPTDPR